ncbi:MAG: GrpB family protein [Legionellales bacterium]|nr:GrpB family protein [Legionellales bacterium]
MINRIIELVPPNSEWITQFKLEAATLHNSVANHCLALHHIGSTAIPDIYAKPVIDLLAIVKDLSAIDKLNSVFENLGYECRGEFGIPGRRFYLKNKIVRTHHLHLFEQGHPEINRHLAFRDYLRSHPNEAKAYSWIKRCLAEQFPLDIDFYNQGKESFIRTIDYRTGNAKSDQLQAHDQIILEPYDPNWKKLAVAEINAIKQVIQLPYLALEHIGSTAVTGLSAKPIIDIVIALENNHEFSHWTESLQAMGYVDWPDNPDKTHARFFKGMPPFGIKRSHHLHIMTMGNEFKHYVAFRDLLNQNARLREQYSKLKETLADRYKNDREAYTTAKAQFIQMVLKKNNTT